MTTTTKEPAEILAAQKALEAWEEIQDARRNYEHENWHAVNVKRHGREDQFDRDDIEQYVRNDIKTLKGGAIGDLKRRALVEYGVRYIENQDNYYHWLEQEWDQLNYEISDIVALGMRDKPFSRIRTEYKWAKGKSILSLGRSGGWACFQVTGDGEELEGLIEEYKDAEGVHDKRDTLREIVTVTKELEETMQEIADIKAFIEKFNKGISYRDEVKYRIEEQAAEIGEIADLACYDTGPDSTVDRYTIIIDGEAYGMSEDAISPAGFNQHIGSISKLAIDALGARIDWEKLPEDVKTGAARRVIV